METIAIIHNRNIIRREITFLPANKDLSLRARALRKAGNYPEVVFWLHVHKRKFHGIDFDRQRVIGNYIVDFYCKSLGLIVEIDGESHNDKEVYDINRETYFTDLGLDIFKTTNYRVLHDLSNVMHELELFLIQNYS